MILYIISNNIFFVDNKIPNAPKKKNNYSYWKNIETFII